jgi:flagellin
MDLEFGALLSEIDRVAKNTTWNTMSILDGKDTTPYDATSDKTTVNIQLGPNSSQVMALEFKAWVPSVTVNAATNAAGADIAVDTAVSDNAADGGLKSSAYGDAILYWGDGVDGNDNPDDAINIDSAANATFAITQLDKAILGVSGERAKYGAYMSRLEHSSDNLLNVAQNTDQSRSRIEDADYAVETSELARTQIISQAATAMLAQANQAKQGVLQLLQ